MKDFIDRALLPDRSGLEVDHMLQAAVRTTEENYEVNDLVE